jgi:hypothetical protein
MSSEDAIILIPIGVFTMLWTLLMGDEDHWDAFERLGAKFGPVIGTGILLLGILIWSW